MPKLLVLAFLQANFKKNAKTINFSIFTNEIKKKYQN
jgi:hypothetical protein